MSEVDVVAAVVAESAEQSARIDSVLAAAVDLARAAAQEMAGAEVGEHLGVVAVEGRVATHEFAATVAGYRGWHWAVTLARAPRSKTVTVDEVVLLPGPGALLAPTWVPWQDRLRPDDLGPGDLLPRIESDPRLVPAYLLSDDPSVEAVAYELGLGRVHVMSRDGRLDVAERWHAGDSGPDTQMARQAPARCGTCGFYLPIEGSLRAAFGVCGNDMTSTDGRVVSVEFGCGAHSEVGAEAAPIAEPIGEVYEDGDVVL
jgi:hypothetical protein